MWRRRRRRCFWWNYPTPVSPRQRRRCHYYTATTTALPLPACLPACRQTVRFYSHRPRTTNACRPPAADGLQLVLSVPPPRCIIPRIYTRTYYYVYSYYIVYLRSYRMARTSVYTHTHNPCTYCNTFYTGLGFRGDNLGEEGTWSHICHKSQWRVSRLERCVPFAETKKNKKRYRTYTFIVYVYTYILLNGVMFAHGCCCRRWPLIMKNNRFIRTSLRVYTRDKDDFYYGV